MCSGWIPHSGRIEKCLARRIKIHILHIQMEQQRARVSQGTRDVQIPGEKVIQILRRVEQTRIKLATIGLRDIHRRRMRKRVSTEKLDESLSHDWVRINGGHGGVLCEVTSSLVSGD
jgi:hypothetical protein